MLDTTRLLEKYLQNYRFKIAKPYLIGDVLDFGGNKGELQKLVKGKYLVVNYDHSVMKNAHFDTIVNLVVIEHIEVDEVFKIYKKLKLILNKGGKIITTTPTKKAEPILKLLSFIGVIDKENMHEHKHYWNKRDLFELAQKTGFKVDKYTHFQLGFNQLAILKHK